MTATERDIVMEFLNSFELVFDQDWEFTKANFDPEMLKCFVSADGTFVNPKIGDESNNWGNRGHLLDAYRHLKVLMSYSSVAGLGSN